MKKGHKRTAKGNQGPAAGRNLSRPEWRRGWGIMAKPIRRSLFNHNSGEYERFCQAKEALGVKYIHDTIRLLVDYYLKHE
jgi:hypothetical protein